MTARKPAPRGTVLYNVPQGDALNVAVGFDLDSADTSARILDGERVTDERYFPRHTVTPTKGEALGFNTEVTTSSDCLCDFKFEVFFADGSSVNVDNNGQPFYVAAFHEGYARVYVYEPASKGFVICQSWEHCRDAARLYQPP